VERVTHKAYVAVGTNMGNRLLNYRKAVARINALEATRVTRESSLYESEPHGRARKWFLNGVVEVSTELEARDLLKALQKIETGLGRKKQKTASVSRVMDLDILLFDQQVLNGRTLKIPHPEIPNRRFVLLPLSELAPALRHPLLSETISTLLVTTKDTKKVGLYKPDMEEGRSV
jgi:2-amino-4-hydroxy-6-hydroxymethyldihydropteridine diphosphokinase